MENSYIQRLDEVVRIGLCTGCGTCVGLCQHSSLIMIKDESRGVYLPKLKYEMCKDCGLCFECCPGYFVNFKKLNLEIFGKEPEDVLIGNFTNFYIGYSTDNKIRYNASSGGLITQLLIFALEEGIIDGALVTRMKKDKPLEPEAFIARTKEEIIDASTSKYCPVPANVVLQQIMREEGKFAVVGLPCHIHGIRKAEMRNKQLRGKILLHIGIFCMNTISFLGTEFLLQSLEIKKEEVKNINYRGCGWPGGMSIKLKNGDEIFISTSEYYDARFSSFIPLRCTLCPDHTCELADVSFGDAWLPELSKDNLGTSIIISRNEVGDEILHNAVSKGVINLIKANRNMVMQSQNMFRAKKKDLNVRIAFFRIFNKVPFYYNQKQFNYDAGSYLRTIWLYFWIFVTSKKCLWFLLNVKKSITQITTYLKERC